MEKQIEVDKIQRIAADEIISLDRQYYGVEPDRALAEMEAYQVAEKLYEEGYRKQSEGEWLPSPDGIKPIRCKNCNTPALFTFEDEFGITGFYRYPSHFCPNCGAKMKGGTE